jgi:hypothetical protein
MSGSGDINQLNVQYQPDVDTASLPSNDMIALMAQIIKLTEVGAGVCFGGDATSMGGVGRTEATNIITAENYNQVDYFKNQLATAIAAIAMSQGRLEHDSTSAANAIVLKAGKIISGVQKNPLTNVNLPADYSTTLPLPKKSDKISFRFTPKFTNTQTDVTILVQDYNASALPVFIGNETSYSVIPINYLNPNQEIEIRTGKYLSSAPSTYSDCFYIDKKFATDAEALAGALNNVALTPLNLKNTTWNPVFVGYTPSNITISSQETYVKFNFSQIATNDNSWYNASNGRFTPTSSGWYQINFTTYGQSNGTSAYYDKNAIFKNGTLFAPSERNSFAGGISINNQYVLLMYFNGTTDYIETFVSFGGSNGTSMTFAGNTQSTQLQIIRLRL